MKLDDITPVILTFNEESNLQRSLCQLSWASRIVVLDSGSIDKTAEIAAQFPNVEFVHRDFDSHTHQWNFGLSLVRTRWALTLDADYVCGKDLCDELQRIDEACDVFLASFRYLIFGCPLRAALYPPRAVLFKPEQRQYYQDGHTQLLDLKNAKVGQLRSVIDHDDRKPLARWIQSQVKYASLEADKLTGAPADSLGWKDQIRLEIVFAPVLTLFYCLFAKRLILDGWAGIYYTLQRVFAEMTLSLVLLDRKVRR